MPTKIARTRKPSTKTATKRTPSPHPLTSIGRDACFTACSEAVRTMLERDPAIRALAKGIVADDATDEQLDHIREACVVAQIRFHAWEADSGTLRVVVPSRVDVRIALAHADVPRARVFLLADFKSPWKGKRRASRAESRFGSREGRS